MIRLLSNDNCCKSDYYKQLYNQSVIQGISAVVGDDILSNIINESFPTKCALPKKLKIKWALSIENIVRQYHNRKQLSIEIADIWAQEGIKTYGLKGWALSTYYPKPELRECGDFDCWLGDNFKRGNQIAIANGAKFNPHDYRHSHINYKGLTIENHRYFLSVRGDVRKKRIERYLQGVISCDRRIESSNIYYPSPQFHALFLSLHMLQHFLYENITLRHMLDWAYFVNAEKDNLDWREFNLKCNEAGATQFIEAINSICIEHMGLNIEGTVLKANNRYADKILRNTLEQASQHVSGMRNVWIQRISKVKNIIAQRWKFNEVYDRNFLHSMLQSAIGVVFDRNVEF